jgi:DNA-binding IclR family transcriptional regulator
VRWYRSSDFAVSTVSLGDVLPLDNTATGLVFQAWLPPERIAAARRMQPPSFRGSPPEPEILEQVRREAGADLFEHLFSLLTGKAAPVFDAQNEIACVVTTVSFIEAAKAEDHRTALFEAAKQASREAGGT